MTKLVWIAALALVPPASAQATDHPDPYASQAIIKADYAAAETRLARSVERGSKEPAVLLNLAQIYHRTGRSYAASELYRAVLGQPDIQMALPSGDPAWSHDLAARGLRRTAEFARR